MGIKLDQGSARIKEYTAPPSDSGVKLTADSKLLTADGRLLISGGKLTSEGRRLAAEGKLFAPDGRLLTGDGKLLVTDGKIIQDAEFFFTEAERALLLQTIPNAKEKENAAKRDEASSRSEASADAAVSLSSSEKQPSWTLEMDSSDWEALLNWLKFSPSGTPEILPDLTKQFGDLSKLYFSLRQRILSSTDGAQAAAQLERLHRALSAALNRLLPASIPCTDTYFSSYGESHLNATLHRSLFYLVTGRGFSERDAESFWEKGKGGVFRDVSGQAKSRKIFQDSSSGPAGNRTAPTPAPAAHAGVVRRAYSERSNPWTSLHSYPAQETTGNAGEAGKCPSPAHSAYQKQLENAKLAHLPDEGRAGVPENHGGRPAPSDLYSLGDMRAAERFFRYMESGGNLFQRRELCPKSEEFLGFLQAFMTIKGLNFAASPSIRASMGNAVRNIVERLVDYHIELAEKRFLMEFSGGRLDRKARNEIYYSIMKEYLKQNDMRDALEHGLKYVTDAHVKKNQEHGPQQSTEDFQAARAAGETRKAAPTADGEGDGERLKKYLEDDLKNYRRSLRRGESRPDYRNVFALAPWGISLNANSRIAAVSKSFLWVVTIFAGAAALFLLFAR